MTTTPGRGGAAYGGHDGVSARLDLGFAEPATTDSGRRPPPRPFIRIPGPTEVIALSDPDPRHERAAAGARPGYRPDVLEHPAAPREIEVTPAVRYDALEQACAAEYPRLVRVLTLYCGDADTARDLVQETCARACAHWSSVRRMQDQRAWFTKVALNLARSRWRRQALERRVLALVGSRPAEAVQRDVAEVLAVRAALAYLTPRQRAAVVLRFLDDLDLQTTATVLRCSEGTVKKLTARGLAALRTTLDFELDSRGVGHV